MLMIFSIFTALTALLHGLFFKLESIDFMRPKVLRQFGLTPEQGPIVKIWAFNQGFYNLFLACGLAYGIYLVHSDAMSSGLVLTRFLLLFITGAGVVLWASAPKKYLAAMIQAVPAILGLIASFLL